jgi:hypothetical protein
MAPFGLLLMLALVLIGMLCFTSALARFHGESAITAMA